MHHVLFICAGKSANPLVSKSITLMRKTRTLTVNEGSCLPGGFVIELKADGTLLNDNETIPPHIQVNKQCQLLIFIVIKI